MSLKVPYTDNLAINAKLPGQVTADFKEAEHEDARDDAKLDQEIHDRKDADTKLDTKIDGVDTKHDGNEQELSQLIQQFKDQITKQIDDDHQDLVNLVNGNFQKMNDKAERVALGIDMDTIRQAVMQVLQEQGVIKRDDPSVPDIKDPDKAASAAGEVAAVTSGEDSRAEAVRSALAGIDYKEG